MPGIFAMCRTLLRMSAWTLVAGLVAATVVPANERPVTGIPHDSEHFLAFAFVGFVFALAYPGRLRRLVPATVAFTLALELSQIPLPTRHARLSDFVYDTLAALVAILAANVAQAVLSRLSRRTVQPAE